MSSDLEAEAWRETARRMIALGLTGRSVYALHRAHEAELKACSVKAYGRVAKW